LYCLAVAVFSTHFKPQKSKAESIAAGKEIYQDFCVICHLSNGEGVSGVFPPLKASDYLFENINRSIAGIKYGLKGEITVNDEIYDGVMANQGLEEEEIADVMNYILNQWGNQSKEFITPQQVAAVPKSILEQ
jgi:mono/diheme cytochrome c family protein